MADGYGGNPGRVMLEEGRVRPASAGPMINPAEISRPYRAMAEAAEALTRTGAEMQQERARTELREYFTELSRTERDMEKQYRERSGSNAFGVGKEIRDFYEKRKTEVGKRFGWSLEASEAALSQLDAMAQRAYGRADTFEARQREAHKADTFEASRMELLDFAYENPLDGEALHDRIALMNDDILSSYAPEQAQLLMRKVQDQVYGRALEAQMRQDPHAARERLENELGPLLSGASRLRMADRIETEIAHRERLQKAEAREAELQAARLAAERAEVLKDRINDAMVYASVSGQEPEGFRDLLAEYAALGDRYAGDAERMTASLDRSREAAVFVRDGERNDDGTLKNIREQYARLETLKPDSAAGAADRMEVYEAARKALDRRASQLKADPAAAVWNDASREVQRLHPNDELDESERIRLTAVRARRMQDELLGGGGRYLPQSATQRMTMTWEEADAGRRLSFLEEFQQGWGELAPQVAREAGLPVAALTALEVLRAGPQAMPDARTLVAAASARPGDIPESLPASQVKEALASSETLGVHRTVAGLMPANARYAEQVRAMEDMLSRAARLSGSETGALLLDKHCTAVNDGQLALILPKDVDDDLVENALADKLDQLPTLLMHERATLGESAWMTRMDELQDAAVWINAPDGDGFVLLNPATQKLVGLDDGSPLRVRLDEIPDTEPEDMDLW